METCRVNFGYNDHGYNEFLAVTSKIWFICGPKSSL